MANILKDVMPKILAQSLITLRENAVMPRLVNSSYSTQAAQKGEIIQVPVGSKVQAQDVVPGPTSQNTNDIEPETRPIVLNRWKEAAFSLSDKELHEVMDGVIPLQVEEAAKSLANAVDADLLSHYAKTYHFSGAPGTTPFAASLNDAVGVRKLLNKGLAPIRDRRLALDLDAEANAILLHTGNNNLASEASTVITEGMIGRRLGFDWYMDQLMPFHTAGDILPKDATTIVTTGAPVSTTTPDASDPQLHNPRTINTIALDTITSGGVVAGDLFKVAGDEQTYVVTAPATSAGGAMTVQFSPAPVTPWATGTAVEFIDSHAVNLGFHRDAIGLAIRPLAGSMIQSEFRNSYKMTMRDPISGIPLRLEIKEEHKRLRYALDILWGSSMLRPENAVRLLG